MQREKRPGAAGERETGQGEEGEGGEREEGAGEDQTEGGEGQTGHGGCQQTLRTVHRVREKGRILTQLSASTRSLDLVFLTTSVMNI